MPVFLTKDQLLTNDVFQLRAEELELPNLGKVYIRELTAAQRQHWNHLVQSCPLVDHTRKDEETEELVTVREQVLGDVPYRMIVWSLCDESLQPIFTEQDIPQIKASWNQELYDLIFDACCDINLVGAEAEEEIAENFTAPQA